MDRNRTMLYDFSVLKTFKIRIGGKKKKYVVRAFCRKDALFQVINQYLSRGWKVLSRFGAISKNCSSLRIYKERKWNSITRKETMVVSAKYIPAKLKKEVVEEVNEGI